VLRHCEELEIGSLHGNIFWTNGQSGVYYTFVFHIWAGCTRVGVNILSRFPSAVWPV